MDRPTAAISVKCARYLDTTVGINTKSKGQLKMLCCGPGSDISAEGMLWLMNFLWKPKQTNNV